jgi:hypothetical protein
MENSGKKNFIFIRMFIRISSSGFINGSILLKIIGCGYPNLIRITDLSGLSKNRIGSLPKDRIESIIWYIHECSFGNFNSEGDIC